MKTTMIRANHAFLLTATNVFLKKEADHGSAGRRPIISGFAQGPYFVKGPPAQNLFRRSGFLGCGLMAFCRRRLCVALFHMIGVVAVAQLSKGVTIPEEGDDKPDEQAGRY